MEQEALNKIKEWINNADALVINTGAGMGVDSGLTDYRGNGGQWGKVESETGQSIFEVANPDSFLENPSYSWKFFGKRAQIYSDTQPHNGFQILKSWIQRYGLDYFILTSNIDGHFQKVGFSEDKIREVHGSISYFQSANPRELDIVWKNDMSGQEILKNIEKGIYPTCPNSNIPARPNIYMFRDSTYNNTRSKKQESNFQDFLKKHEGNRILCFEIGSGPHVQTIRVKTRLLRSNYKANIVRINPVNFKIKSPNIGIPKGALAALTEIDALLKNK